MRNGIGLLLRTLPGRVAHLDSTKREPQITGQEAPGSRDGGSTSAARSQVFVQMPVTTSRDRQARLTNSGKFNSRVW